MAYEKTYELIKNKLSFDSLSEKRLFCSYDVLCKEAYKVGVLNIDECNIVYFLYFSNDEFDKPNSIIISGISHKGKTITEDEFLRIHSIRAFL